MISLNEMVTRSDGAKLAQIPAKRPANALSELVAFLGRFAVRCREMQWLQPGVHVGVLSHIAADAVRERQQIARDGYSAEQADLEADKELLAAREELQAAIGDGHLDNQDIPRVTAAICRLKTARRHVQNSAKKDHVIAGCAG